MQIKKFTLGKIYCDRMKVNIRSRKRFLIAMIEMTFYIEK